MNYVHRVTGRVPDLLPEATVAQLQRYVKSEWMNQPEQLRALESLKSVGYNAGKANRTMHSRWRTVLKVKYGGELWFRVLISTGTIPQTMIKLANKQLAQRQQPRSPASSRGPVRAAPAGAPTGSQHQVSGQKRQRDAAKRLTKLVCQEDDRRRYAPYKGKLSDGDFAQLQSDAQLATKRASDASRASGYAYKLDGQTHGAPETSIFAILLADFCGELNIDVRTGHLTTLRNR